MPEGPFIPPTPADGPPVTTAVVARWMLAELARRGGVLHESTAALEIIRLFGGSFCDVTPQGHYTVAVPVLDAFARAALLGENEVLWNDVERAWRFSARRPNPYR